MTGNTTVSKWMSLAPHPRGPHLRFRFVRCFAPASSCPNFRAGLQASIAQVGRYFRAVFWGEFPTRHRQAPLLDQLWTLLAAPLDLPYGGAMFSGQFNAQMRVRDFFARRVGTRTTTSFFRSFALGFVALFSSGERFRDFLARFTRVATRMSAGSFAALAKIETARCQGAVGRDQSALDRNTFSLRRSLIDKLYRKGIAPVFRYGSHQRRVCQITAFCGCEVRAPSACNGYLSEAEIHSTAFGVRYFVNERRIIGPIRKCQGTISK